MFYHYLFIEDDNQSWRFVFTVRTDKCFEPV